MASKLNLKQQIFMNRASLLQGSQHFSFCQGKPRKKSFPFKREVNDGQQERECWKLNTRKSFWTEGRLDLRRIHQLCAWSLRLCCKPLINRGVLFIDTRETTFCMRHYRFCGPRDYGNTEGIKFVERAAQRTVLLELVSGQMALCLKVYARVFGTFVSLCRERYSKPTEVDQRDDDFDPLVSYTRIT